MSVASQCKQINLLPALYLKQVAHQHPLHDIHHILGQVVSKIVVHLQSMNCLQLGIHQYHTLIQEHSLVVQRLGVNSLLMYATIAMLLDSIWITWQSLTATPAEHSPKTYAVSMSTN